jgi:hypothetical protein
MAFGSRVPGLQQLIGNLRQRTDNYHRPRAEPAFDDSDESPNGGGVLDRRPTKFHYDHILTKLKSALSLWTAHVLSAPFFEIPQKQKPTARSLLAVGFGDLA